MSENVDLPAGALEVIDRLRGTSSRSEWLKQAALHLARQQSGHDPDDPLDWHNLDSNPDISLQAGDRTEMFRSLNPEGRKEMFRQAWERSGSIPRPEGK